MDQSFLELLENAEYWHWWAASLVFLILEVVAPGFILIWFGASAFFVGAILLIAPLDGQVQLAVWAVFSIVSIFAWRAYRKKYPADIKPNTLNKRGQDYIGRRFTLTDDVTNGYGKIKVDDSTWKVALDDDLKAGDTIIVTDIDGTILKAEKVG